MTYRRPVCCDRITIRQEPERKDTYAILSGESGMMKMMKEQR